MRNSIGKLLTVAFVGLAVGPLLLVGIVLAWQSFTTQEQQARNLQSEVALRISTQVDAYFSEMENEMRIVSRVQGLQKLERDKQANTLSALLSSQRAFEELILLDNQGQEQARASRSGLISSELADLSENDAFVVPKTSGGAYYSLIRTEKSTNEPVITIAVPLFDAGAETANGVLVATVRFKSIGDLIASVQVSPGQSVYIVDAQNQVVAHRDPSLVLAGTTFQVPDQSGMPTGLTGARVILAVNPVQLGQQKFNVIAEQTLSEALAQAINTVLITAGLIVLMLAVSGTLGLVIVRQIVQPIQSMATAAQAIRAGDLSQQVKVVRRDELGVLADAFNGMTTQLQSLIGSLEQRVAERTAILQRRSLQLQATTEVAHAAAAELDVETLMRTTVARISNRFDYYHAGIFLLDEKREYAILRAASSEGGQQMLARGHRLRIKEEGIVGYVADQGQARIALDAGKDAAYFSNPDLPQTRSEMALPLQVREEVIGVLDVQSAEPEAFGPEDVAALQALADQVAMAINNARLFKQVQESLEAERRAYGELTREAWAGLLRARSDWRERYDPQGILSSDGLWRQEMKEAMQTGKTVLGERATSAALATPIKVRDQVIGIVDAHKPAGAGAWSPAEIALLETLVGQLGVALDSARLYEDTQRRAARERLINEITARIRSSVTMDGVLNVAVREISQVTGASSAAIDLELVDTA